MVKHDAFREKTMETVEYVSGHRSQFVRYGGIALALLILAGGIWIYRDVQHSKRQAAIAQAFKVFGSQIVAEGNPPPFVDVWFRTKTEQQAAIKKAFTEVADQYGSADEAMMARFYLGLIAGDAGDIPEATKQFQLVADQGSNDYASMAKLSLAQILKNQGKVDEGAKLLRSVVDNPSNFVSKEQATIELARLIGSSKPEEARKLLEPLRTARTAVSQAALTALSDLQQQK